MGQRKVCSIKLLRDPGTLLLLCVQVRGRGAENWLKGFLVFSPKLTHIIVKWSEPNT